MASSSHLRCVRGKRPVVLALVQHRGRHGVSGIHGLLVLQATQKLAEEVVVKGVPVVVYEVGVPTSQSNAHTKSE